MINVCCPYRAVVDKRNDPSPSSELHKATVSVFTRTFFANLIGAMVSNFFPTTVEDLKQWEREPESFVGEERRCAWRDSKKVTKRVFPIHVTYILI